MLKRVRFFWRALPGETERIQPPRPVRGRDFHLNRGVALRVSENALEVTDWCEEVIFKLYVAS